MTLFDWLVAPQGQALTNAFILVLVAGAGFLSYLARQQSSKNESLLNTHIDAHLSGKLPQKSGEIPTDSDGGKSDA